MTKLLPTGNSNLLLDEIKSCNHFCNGMLHLEPGIHFQKIKTLVGIDEEFDRPSILVVASHCQFDSRCSHAGSQLRSHHGRRAFFDEFLMPSLYRTFALSQVDDIAKMISQYLNFNMTRA